VDFRSGSEWGLICVGFDWTRITYQGKGRLICASRLGDPWFPTLNSAQLSGQPQVSLYRCDRLFSNTLMIELLTLATKSYYLSVGGRVITIRVIWPLGFLLAGGALFFRRDASYMRSCLGLRNASSRSLHT